MAALNPLNLAKSVVWRVGFALRESGQALERVGCRLQGIYSFKEQLSRHTSILPQKFDVPSVGKDAFIAPSSLVTGKVTLGDKSSVWYSAVIRGDGQPVTIGSNTNIQDNAFIGATSEYSPECTVGNNVSIGHSAVLKGCTVGNNVLIGIGAVISEGCKVGSNSIVAAGSYVEEDTVIPSGEVWAGNPAQKLRDLKPQEQDYLKDLPGRYAELGAQHEEIMQLLRAKQAEYSREL